MTAIQHIRKLAACKTLGTSAAEAPRRVGSRGLSGSGANAPLRRADIAALLRTGQLGREAHQKVSLTGESLEGNERAAHRCAHGAAKRTHGAAPQEAAPPAARRAASSAALPRETSTKAAGLRRALRHRDDDRSGHGRAAVAPADAQQPHSNATKRTLHSHLVECAAARRSLWIEF